MNQKNNMKKITKFLSLKKAIVFSGVTTLVVVPATITFSAIELSKKTYSLGDKSFTSKESAINYVKNSSTKIENKTEGDNSSWQITYQGQTKKFSDPESLRKYVDTLITNKGSYMVGNNSYVKNQSLNSLDSIDWNKVYSLNNTKEGQTLTQTIYQGLNDQSFDNIDDAINSFYNNDTVKTGYYFNNTYFANKSDLKEYLTTNYLPSNKSSDYKTIVLKGPNGTSTPISFNDATKAVASIKQFIANNAKATIKYTNSKTNKTVNIDESNVNSTMSDVDNSDLSYVSMKSNEGESRYIVDNYDSSNLIGPYLYNGVLDVGSFTNKSMWKKANNISSKVYTESKVNTMIGTFFSSIIVDDKALSLSEYEQDTTKDVPLFRTTLLAADGVNTFYYDEKGNKQKGELSLDEWFLKELNIISPTLKQEVMNANLQMMRGNKYNTFYKIPVLYSYLMQRVVEYGLGQDAIDLIVYYFTEVCNYIQDAIELTLMDSSLLVNSDGEKFDVKTLFNIGNMNFDLNTNFDYFFNKIKEWPKMIAAMDAYIEAYNNLVMTAGLVPFTSCDQSYLVENGVISYGDLESIKRPLMNIYLAFSQTNYANFLSVFVPNSTDSAIKAIAQLSTDQWEKKLDETPSNHSSSSMGVILKSCVQQNNQHQTLARTILLNEVRIYLATGSILPSGYLSLLYSKTPSANKIDSFVDFVSANPGLDAYKVYLVFILDLRMQTNEINNSSLSSVQNFGRALTRIIWTSLGTSLMVSNSLKSLYNTVNFSLNNSVPSSGSSDVTTADLLDRLYALRNIPKPENSQLLDAISMGSVETLASWDTEWDDSSSIHSGSLRDEVVYVEPEKLFEKVSNRGTLDEDGKIGFISIKDDGLKSEYEEIKKPSTSTLNTTDISATAQVENVAASATQSNNVTASDGTSTFKSNVNDGMVTSKDNKRVSLIMPTDEVKVSNTSSFPTIDTTVQNKFKDNQTLNFGNRNSYIGDKTGYADINASTTFTSSFRKKISMDKLYSFGDKVWESAKKVASAIKSAILPIMSIAFSSLETYFFIFDLINVTRTQDFYVYTASDGTQFIWDGGVTVSKLLGFQTYQESNIDSMKLIQPIQVTLPQIEEYYYYNNKRYYDINDLKRAQLLYMIRNKYSGLPTKFTIDYSMSNEVDSGSTTIDKLFENVMSSIGATKKDDGTYDFSKVNDNSSYVASISSGIKGTENISSTDYGNIAEVILKTIRPTNIAQLPEIDGNNKTTGKIKDFVYPSQYYNSTTKQIIKNTDTSLQYIIDDLANTKDSNGNFVISSELEADTKSKETLKSTFKTKLEGMISSKDVLKNDYVLGDSKYSSLSSDFGAVNLYEVTIKNQSKYFDSINEARSYLLEELNFKKNEAIVVKNSYIYKNNYFANDEALKQWVLNNIITK